jgi:pyocin large subunit-like protein
LYDSKGNVLTVEDSRLEVLEKAVKVYNFQVEDFHTYHVGANGILVHNTCKGANAKIINSSDDVTISNKSIDKAFGKHGQDFGNYADGTKFSVDQFKSDVKNLIDTGVQKSGTWKGVSGTHIYNPDTQQWVFINSDGTLNTAFKLSESQFKYLLETGVVK